MEYDFPDLDVNREIWKQLGRRRSRTIYPPTVDDSPQHCYFGVDYYNSHPQKNYSYVYNAWGLRGEEYTKYIGQTVNLCVGDSYTLNVGGPIENSWPSLLSKKFNVPTLNFGISGLSFYHAKPLVDKLRKTFKVQHVFVLYNVFDRDSMPYDLKKWHNFLTADRIRALRNYCLIHDAHWQFDPPWSFFNDEIKLLHEVFPGCHNYIQNVNFSRKNIDLNLLLSIVYPKKKYIELSGPSWPSYESFCQHYLLERNVLDLFNSKIDQKLINEFLINTFVPTAKRMLLTNRDGMHLSLATHQALAEYFYSQVS